MVILLIKLLLTDFVLFFVVVNFFIRFLFILSFDSSPNPIVILLRGRARLFFC